MACKFIRKSRFIGDNREILQLPVDITAGAVSAGNFLAKSNPTAGVTVAAGAFPFSDLTDSGSLLQNQQAARDRFVGIAQAPAAAASNIYIPVAIKGVFEVPCLSGTYEVGYLVGACGTTAGVADGGNDGVSSTTVQRVTDASAAIGRVVRRGTTITSVQIEIISRIADKPNDDALVADTIAENTSATGVTVDGVLLKDAGITATGTTVLGGTNAASIKGIYYSGTIVVAVPTIANDAAENADSVAVDVSAMTFAPAVGDAVVAVPLEALPTDCLLCGAYVTATDQVTVTFASKEGGGVVTGANKNFGFIFLDIT